MVYINLDFKFLKYWHETNILMQEPLLSSCPPFIQYQSTTAALKVDYPPSLSLIAFMQWPWCHYDITLILTFDGNNWPFSKQPLVKRLPELWSNIPCLHSASFGLHAYFDKMQGVNQWTQEKKQQLYQQSMEIYY